MTLKRCYTIYTIYKLISFSKKKIYIYIYIYKLISQARFDWADLDGKSMTYTEQALEYMKLSATV